MIDRLHEIIITACGGSLSISEIGWLFVVLRCLVSFCAWLIKHFEGVLND